MHGERPHSRIDDDRRVGAGAQVDAEFLTDIANAIADMSDYFDERYANVTLRGAYVTLEPLSLGDHDRLVDAVRDGEIWRLTFTNVPTPEAMGGEIERRLDLASRGTMVPFVVRAGGVTVGMTTYMNVDRASRRLEIGSTWYRRSFTRTAVNTEAKFLLLGYAFERFDVIAVEFRTSALNLASQRAIERLGATRDGVLRSHGFHRDGSLRDTIVYSIIASEWPSVRTRLIERLSRR